MIKKLIGLIYNVLHLFLCDHVECITLKYTFDLSNQTKQSKTKK